MLLFNLIDFLWLIGDNGDVGGGELPLLCDKGGVIGHPGGKNGVCVGRPIVDASWARNWIGHDAMRAAAAAVGFVRSCGAKSESAGELKQAKRFAAVSSDGSVLMLVCFGGVMASSRSGIK